jgi:hypothetical protein
LLETTLALLVFSPFAHGQNRNLHTKQLDTQEELQIRVEDKA